MKKWFRSVTTFLLAVFMIAGSSVLAHATDYDYECDHTYLNGFCSLCDAFEPAADADSDGVFEIGNGGQLYWFASIVNSGEADADAVLTADIVVNRNVLVGGELNTDAETVAGFRTWSSIGFRATTSRYLYYTGTFDGQDHTISGLYYRGSNNYVGLFGCTDSGAVIRGVNLADSWFSAGSGVGYASVGGIVGRAANTVIDSCTNSGVVIGNGNAVGGIVGEAVHCSVRSCGNTGAVTGTARVGGIAGALSGSVFGCDNSGVVTGSKAGSGIGGIVGNANHYSDDASSDDYYTYIDQSSNTGDVRNGDKIGGILGSGNFCVLEDCYNTGTIAGDSDLSYAGGAGGVIGEANRSCTITDCHNVGTVTANYQSVSAIMGNGIESTITNCYYLAASETDSYNGTTFKTEAQFASGEVTWLLNGSTDAGELVWFQIIGEDECPVFEGSVVHYEAGKEPPYFNVDVHKHDWTVTYDFAADGSACTATRTCTKDATHVETATATVTSEVTKAATCEAKGETTYTATFTEDWAETQTLVVEDVAALGHAYGAAEYTWSEDGKTCTAKRTCGNDAEHVETATATVTSEVTKAPTCEAMGETTYTATFNEDWAETQTKTIADVAVLDHTPAEAVRENEKAATCTAEGSYDEVVYCSVCGEELSRETKTIEKLAHTPAEVVREKEVEATCDKAGSYDEVVYCSVCEEELSRKTVTVDALGHKDANKDHKCDACDKVLSECVDENKDYKCDICGKDLEKPEDPSDPVEEDEVIRLAGSHRWETALKVADEMKANLGVEKFGAIIIASGNDFADALAGSYLSTVKNAPILLGWGKGGKFEYLDTDNIEYIKANLAEGGTVYILGGKNAVPELYENELKGYNVKRLGGANRFETNLLILAEAGVADGSEILVCTATNFADSLSASATAKPILLVFNEYGKLYGKQPEFLAGLKNCTFTVIGGESAVSAKLADAIKAYGSVTRLAGANRFETSVMVAQKYFKDVDTAVLAYAWNYPDGLCGGSLAYSLKAPLILTMTKYEAKAIEYAKDAGIETGLVLGGETLISDEAVRAIFAMDAADEITEK